MLHFVKWEQLVPPKSSWFSFSFKKKKTSLGFFFWFIFVGLLKKKSSASSVCVNTFPFFVLGGVFCSFPSLSPRFVLNRSGTTTKKGKTRKRRKKKTDQLAILQSFVHLTGTGLPPATSPLRGEERWEGEEGGRGGTSLHIKSDLKNKTEKKKKHLWTFFLFFTVLK